jgi:hypothetical protein
VDAEVVSAPISSTDAANINFNGEQLGPVAQIAGKQGYTIRIDGNLDRVTGHMAMYVMAYETKRLSDPNNSIVSDHYDVLRKATNRVF